jgi:hypothetical protein
VLTVEADIADPAAAGWIIGGALERFGHIDTLADRSAGQRRILRPVDRVPEPWND